VAAVPSIGRASRVDRPQAAGAAAAGDLYERYSGQIFGYCMHQLGSREEAEDAVQTTFMNAFRGLQRGVVPELESAWLFKIAHNVCLSRRRSSWRRGRVEAPNNFEVLQEIVPGREQVADELIRLQDVLESMPENQRRAILLREWQGMTYREISDELGLSQAAVETLIFRARRALAQGLEQDADTWKKRLRRGADVGGAIACVKTLLGGGGAAAIKIGTTAALVASAAVAAATAPVIPKHHHQATAPRVVKASKPPAVASHPTPVVAAVSQGVTRTNTAKAPAARPHATVAPQAPRPVSSAPASASASSAPAAPPPAPVVPATAKIETPAPTPPVSTPPPAPAPAPAPPPQTQPPSPTDQHLPPPPAREPTEYSGQQAGDNGNRDNRPDQPNHGGGRGAGQDH
jgi:RNA polymerase sigma factor (sigma-70 family)